MEINILKKKLKEQPLHHTNHSSNNHDTHGQHNSHIQQSNQEGDMANLSVQADREVDSLMNRYDHMPGMSIALPGMTPFSTWKMQQYLASAAIEEDEKTVDTEKVKKFATTSLKDFNEIRKKIAEVTLASSNDKDKNDKKTTTILPTMNIRQAVV